MQDTIVRIGGACGFWGDSGRSTPQLLRAVTLDYIIYDYLAEITMAVMARARAADETKGYATDFIGEAMAPNLQAIADGGVKIIANAGGVNVRACKAALEAAIATAGVDLKVAAIVGDDLMADRADILTRDGIVDMDTGETAPDASLFQSVNAYLGAGPIKAALDAGADIVVTGRVVDSALTLGALMHAFDWSLDDYDRMAAGSLIGHILECGPHATGGNFTDWHLVADQLTDIGYPIAEVASDGSAVMTKPDGTGGLVSRGTIGEQLLYEIGDPSAYLLPDVAADFSHVQINEVGDDRVAITGARGRAPSGQYKVCATYMDGWRAGMMVNYFGLDAANKALAYKDALLDRAEALLAETNMGGYDEVSVELIGAGSQYGDDPRNSDAREVVLKLGVRHPHPKGAGLIMREGIGLGLTMPPGMSLYNIGRQKPQPVLSLFSFLIDREAAPASLLIGDVEQDLPNAALASGSAGACEAASATPAISDPVLAGDEPLDYQVTVRDLAFTRSGDKGDHSNIGVLAREDRYLPYLWAALTPEAVGDWFGHFIDAEAGSVERYLMPGPKAINLLMRHALGSGGVASLRADPQGKAFGQVLADMPVAVPQAIAEAAA